MAEKQDDRRAKYPNLWKYANWVDIPGGRPLDVDMELVRLEEMAEALERQIEQADATQAQQKESEAAKVELKKRIDQLQADAARLNPQKEQATPAESPIMSLADLEPPMPTGDWARSDWYKFFYWITQVHGNSQPDWKFWATRTGKAYGTMRKMYSEYMNGGLQDAK